MRLRFWIVTIACCSTSCAPKRNAVPGASSTSGGRTAVSNSSSASGRVSTGGGATGVGGAAGVAGRGSTRGGVAAGGSDCSSAALTRNSPEASVKTSGVSAAATRTTKRCASSEAEAGARSHSSASPAPPAAMLSRSLRRCQPASSPETVSAYSASRAPTLRMSS